MCNSLIVIIWLVGALNVLVVVLRTVIFLMDRVVKTKSIFIDRFYFVSLFLDLKFGRCMNVFINFGLLALTLSNNSGYNFKRKYFEGRSQQLLLER